MEQPAKKTPILLFVLGIVLAALFIGVFAFFRPKPTPPLSQSIETTTNREETTEHGGESSGPQDPSADASALYMGAYKGKEVLFYNNGASGDGFTGTIVYADGNQESNIDYRTMDNIRILYTPSGNLSRIVNYGKSPDSNYLYVSLLMDTTNPEFFVNKVYRIAMVNLTGSEVWTNSLQSNKYNVSGEAMVVGVGAEKAVALSLLECLGCKEQIADSIVVNSQTKADIRVGPAENFTYNPSNNSFSYIKSGSQATVQLP